AIDIEGRLDRRSHLALAIQAHQGRLCTMFGVPNIDDPSLTGVERESIRRVVKCRVIRESRWSILQATIQAGDVDAFTLHGQRCQNDISREQFHEQRLMQLLADRRERLKVEQHTKLFASYRTPVPPSKSVPEPTSCEKTAIQSDAQPDEVSDAQPDEVLDNA